jgi:hypothetical protein
MKKSIAIALIAAASIAILIALSLSSCAATDAHKAHTCIDATHAACDGYCECDGLGCPH